METFNRIAPDVSLGRSAKIFGLANLYGCTVGDESRLGCFVEIQKNAIAGAGAVVTKSVAPRTVVAAGTLGKPRRWRHAWQ